jgi:hypothetical protein
MDAMQRWERSRYQSSWLSDRIDDQRELFELRARQFSVTSRIAFGAFLVCLYTTFHEWPTIATGAIQIWAFWLAILSGAVAVVTWNRARIQRSLMEIPLER